MEGVYVVGTYIVNGGIADLRGVTGIRQFYSLKSLIQAL